MSVSFVTGTKIMSAVGMVSDTAANLESSTKVIPDGVWLKESDTSKLKLGNGTDVYTDLPYIYDGSILTGLPLFFSFYHRSTILHPSYVQAEQFSWHSGAIFVTAYNTLESEYNDSASETKTETISGTTITYKLTPNKFKICNSDQQDNIISVFGATGQADFFIINTTDKYFKLPRVPWSKYKSTNNSSSVEYQQYYFLGNSIENDSTISLDGVIQLVEELNNTVADLSGYMPVTGGVFSGSVQFNAGTFQNVVALSSNTIDLSKGSTFTKTITAATTLSCIGVPSGASTVFTLVLVNGGNYTVTWPSSFKWTSATPPELTSNGTDILTFITVDGGSTWYGTMSIQSAG